MKILVINAGSSSVKFTAFNIGEYQVLANGIVERIGLTGTRLKYHRSGGEAPVEKEVQVEDTRTAVGLITEHLTDGGIGVIKSVDEIGAVGHRVVHGGEKMTQPVIIDEEAKEVIKECFELAPLHNPHNLRGILACEEHFPEVPQVAVFDTAFHATIPEHAYLYGIPYKFYRDNKIRRYGFHGVSHKYVSTEAAKMLEKHLSETKIITCHLGNGCSITAVDGGKSVDTSMGFTPLEGLIMGTRCGDIDPAIVFYLMEYGHLNPDQVNRMLNTQSGLLGLAEIESSDLRDILQAMENGNKQAKSAVLAFVYRIKKYIGAYAAALGSVDAVVFTGGIGENSPLVRQLALGGLDSGELFCVAVDPIKNANTNGKACEIQSEDSRIRVLLVPTNEELEIARQTWQVLHEKSKSQQS